MSILAQIQKIIREKYPQVKQNITSKTVLGTIDYFDSLELATIAVQLESIYNIRFPDELIENIKTLTIQDIIDQIESLIAEKKHE